MASRPRFFETAVTSVELHAEPVPYARFTSGEPPFGGPPQERLLSDPGSDSFFATAQIDDVHSLLNLFHRDRPDMLAGNRSVPSMLNNLSGEIEEVGEDWTEKETMSPDAYRAQEVADCLIFILAISTQLGLKFDQAEVEEQSSEILRSYPRHVDSAVWTVDHESAYWELFSQLHANIFWLRQGNWPERFDEMTPEDSELWRQRLYASFVLGWSLHRLYGLSPTREMLDKIARNMAKYPAGRRFHKPSRRLSRYRKRTKEAYKKRNMNAEHFAMQYPRTSPAELGRPLPMIVAAPLPETSNLLR